MKLWILLGGLLLATVGLNAKSSQTSGEELLQKFFQEFGKGNAGGVLDCFHPQAKIVSVRNGNRSGEQLYGTYNGRQGAEKFLQNLGANFDTKKFEVEQIVGKNEWVFASGTFLHLIKQTGKPFASDWALKVQIKDGKIVAYHFYEDSASFMAASEK